MPKAKPATTLVTFLLDRSGSMNYGKDDTIGGFNAYIDGLKKDGAIKFSFLQFDSISLDTVCKNKPIKDVPHLTAETFQPRGGTPLIDACYATIEAVAEALSHRDDKPKVIVVFQTDGQENASRIHGWHDLNDLIKAKTEAGWQFNFMGASIDAYQQAAAMGVSSVNTVSYGVGQANVMNAFTATADNSVRYSTGLASSTQYSVQQKSASGDAFDPEAKK